MEKIKLKQAQKIMISMLKEIDIICRKHNINYWIESGTLLGAIRHNGFIPWDDDIDIGMIREDYIKFLNICKEELSDDLFVQNFNTEENIEFQWSKIKHKYSKIIEERNCRCHQGLFIDIFQYDYYNDMCKDTIKCFKKENSRKWSIVLYSQNKILDFYKRNLKENIKVCIYKIYNKFILKDNLHNIINRCDNFIKLSMIDKENANWIGYGVELFYFNNMFEKNIIFPIKRIKFENLEVNCPNNSKRYLECLYGNNYMEIPPKDKQINHNTGIYIDMDKNRR